MKHVWVLKQGLYPRCTVCGDYSVVLGTLPNGEKSYVTPHTKVEAEAHKIELDKLDNCPGPNAKPKQLLLW